MAWEACKQSGRQFLPTLASAPDLASIPVEHPAHATRERVAWLLHPLDACTPGVSLRQPMAHGFESVTILVGPEGGFSAPEIEAARTAGYSAAHLGGTILRAETAAPAGCAVALFGASP
ncbi:MAG: RNA methyltransferase [SAR324 cluster bacterium]|nr:RNA methyltransferase [SAR324 cluster bacterium]